MNLLNLVKKLVIPVTIMGFFGFFLLLGVVYGYQFKVYKEDRKQPIQYDHSVHVTKLNLPCTKCHIYGDTSREVKPPSMQVCMECHQSVQTDSPEVQKLIAYWNKQEPIPWARIHRLPDFIYFSHKRHIQKGLDCTECHGQVPWMSEMRQVPSLKMGWCVTCHVAKSAPRDCLTCHK